MATITSIKCVLTQEQLDSVCIKYFVPEEVHPQLPGPNNTMHERPSGKVGMYTRFFDYANYRIPFSNFFVSVLVHFRIPFSQLSVFGSAKVPGGIPSVRVGISRKYLLRRYLLDLSHEDGEEMDLERFLGRPQGGCRRVIERELAEDAVGGGVRKTLPLLVMKKRVTRGSERTPAASHPPKRLRADYGTTGGSATGGKSPSVLNRLLQDSRLMVEQGVPALPTLPFITSSVTASPLEEGGDHTDSVTGPFLRTVGPSARFVVLSDSSHHSATNSAGPEGDSFVRSAVPVMTEATTVTTIATTVAIPADVGKDKSSGFAAGSIRAEEVTNAGLEEIYVPEWTVTKGFELNDGRFCANMIDHFTPHAFFKTVRGMEHEQLFAEFNVSVAHNLSLSSEVRMRAEYNILEKRKWRSLAEEKDSLLGAKDKEIEELRSQLLKAKEGSVVVAQLRARVHKKKKAKRQSQSYIDQLDRCGDVQDGLSGPDSSTAYY
ncbi:hypothetical protein Tco_0407866 [Tanacetum coccineum]